MRRTICGLLSAVFVTLAVGCSSDKDKGINSNKERPREPKAGAQLKGEAHALRYGVPPRRG